MMSIRLDGELGAEDVAEMDAHLLCCLPCQRRWAQFQLIALSFEISPELDPPVDFTARVMASLDRPIVAKSPVRLIWPYLLVAGGLLGVSVFTFLVWAGISSWSVITHPALGAKVVDLARVFVSVLSAVVRALWSSLVLLDSQEVGIVGVTSGLVALILVLVWARLVGQWWQLGNGERAAS